ncbi:alpha/beta-hydrolase [Tothia fuscella]|uniref:Alpha/beta-hydrolase n=1 Tax=Tothia fuscella TaxID=1048955 RepID=A0A9P4NVJ1_9PEZI|nr:alpha/beta-hydrolase [Tothia fuscella]
MATHTHVAVASAAKPTSIIWRVLWKGFGFVYGTFSLGAFVLLSYVKKGAFRRMDRKEKGELKDAQDRLWDLSKKPFGLIHCFCTLRSGVKLHYVESLPQTKPSSQTSLVIFLHGFPDSYYLWRPYLTSDRLQSQAVMVAVDLPGFGGSDNLPQYGADEVLESISEFILQMREKYVPTEVGQGRSSSRVVIVGHDWGAVIGMRLASEAPQLGDRFVMSNCLHVTLAYSNVASRLSTARQMLHTFTQSPRQIRLLARAFSNIRPLLRQIRKSGYVFVFNLPKPMANIVGSLGNFWLFRYMNAISTHPNPNTPIAGLKGAELLASSIGPSEKECTTSPNGSPELTYGPSVLQRAISRNGGFTEKINLYRQGLLFNPWEKSLQTLWDLNQIEQSTGRRQSSGGLDLFDVGPAGSLRAPMTVIWGKRDVAIENAIAIEGIGDFMGVRPSQLLVVEGCGHWVPIQEQGVGVFEEVIGWAVEGEKGGLRERFGEGFVGVKFAVERLVK